MTLTESPTGGAVFSVGSINWLGSLPSNDFDNNVSRVTENVLRHFSR
jgi:N,N-dimethylformamidase